MTENRFLRMLGISGEPQPPAVLNKEGSVNQYCAYMYDRTASMFEWSNLPDTIPQYLLELYIQYYGFAIIANISSSQLTPYTVNGHPYPIKPGLYCFHGSLGGELDMYYRPTFATIAHPRLKSSLMLPIAYKSVDRFEDMTDCCVVIRNDTNHIGLQPLYRRYAEQLTENDISIRSSQINSRTSVGITVSNDRDAESARRYLDELEAGKLGIIADHAFLEGIGVTDISTSAPNSIIQLIELQQYLKASWFNEMGLNVNFNMKREYMSEEEIGVNTDVLLPLVDDMLSSRREAVELINSIFSADWSVDKSSSWANKQQESLTSNAGAANDANVPIDPNIEGGELLEANVSTPLSESVPSVENRSTEATDVQAGPSPEASVPGQASGDGALSPDGNDITININIGGDADVQTENSAGTSETSNQQSDDE